LPPPHIKKARLHKLFILDSKGDYHGEIPLDETCLVEYGEVLEAAKGQGIADGESIFLSGWKVTAISGERMGLLAVSTGSLGSDELTWARMALHAAEATLTGDPKPAPRARDEQDEDKADQGKVLRQAPAPAPPPAPPPASARRVTHTPRADPIPPAGNALEAQEKALKKREEALRMMEENTRASVEEFRRNTEAQIEDLRTQLVAARREHERTQAALAGERERARARPVAAPPQAIPRATPPPTPQVPLSDRELVDVREEIEREKVHLQKRAIEFLEREETLRDRETKVEDDGRRLAQGREEIERLRTEVEAAKATTGEFEREATRQEVDERVRALQQKTSDLLAREEQLKKRAVEIRALLNGET
jgi:hypothetical protein